MTLQDLSPFILQNYDVREWRHATAILAKDFPDEFKDIVELLTDFRLYASDIILGGGNKSKVAKRVDATLIDKKEWKEKAFDVKIEIDGVERDSPTHKIDCVKNHVGFEVEWNNKDPFYDRDLNNFRLLFDMGAISVGVILTRSSDLEQVFRDIGRYSSYGQSTTHWNKLIPRLEGGAGGGCPVLAFGIKPSLYVDDMKA